jgi:hypothetical protein|tara:strand:+ start:135 stop:1127 length:993 start_codon:yes stop_codon:yes gene_type:complete
MTFFDPKEEVMDIELTQHGKRLLSRGRLKPSYYLFFDDDVLYDSACAGNTLESQNAIEKRILEETPRVKTQYNFAGLSEDVLADSLPSTAERHFSINHALGTSDIQSDYYPGWNINMFGDDGPTITKSVEHLTSSFVTLKIPQNDISLDFKTTVSSELSTPTIDEDVNLSSHVKADGTYISIQPRTLLMEVLESNTSFGNENFDIEVFIQEKELDLADDGSIIGELDAWTPLSFKKKRASIVDGILLDEQPEICHDLDPTYVEYYFDIFTDNEISEETRDSMQVTKTMQNMYVSKGTSGTPAATFAMADIYSKVVPDDACPVDPCDDKTS